MMGADFIIRFSDGRITVHRQRRMPAKRIKTRKGKDYELYDCKRQTYSTDKQQGRGASVNYQRREGVPVAGGSGILGRESA